MRNKFLISIIVYNPERNILDNIARIISSNNILIVDNSDSEVSWLKELCIVHNLQYNYQCGNVGIASALNVAADYAITNGYTYLVSIDQDSNITQVIINELFAIAEKFDNNVATISPLHINEKVTIATPDEDFTDSIFGLQSANIINLAIWQKLHGFDESLFIDMVDTDYYIRAKLAGYKCITCNNIPMVHQVGSDVKEFKIFGKYIRAFNHSHIRKYYQARNFTYIYFKYRKRFPEVIYFMKIILTMPLTIIMFESNKVKKLKYYTKGLIDMCFNKMGKLIE